MDVARRFADRVLLPIVVAVVIVGCGSQTPTSAAGTAPPSAGTSATPGSSAGPGGVGRWIPAGSLPNVDPGMGAAIWPTVVATPDGRALGLGADNRCAPGGPVLGDGHTVGLFEPATDTWATTAPLNKDRGAFVALALADGRVLVTGGANSIDAGEASFSSTKLWDAASGAWRDGGLLNHARTGAFGTLLADGRVITGGGYYYDGRAPQRALASAEVYDPSADRWTDVASMPGALEMAKAVTLTDGRVLAVGFAGGTLTLTAYLYDSAENAWTDTASPPESPDRFELVAISGGGAVAVLQHPYRFDAAAGTWGILGLDRDVLAAQAAVLPNGHVILAGGEGSTTEDPDTLPAVARVDDWDPASDTWTALAAMPDGRQDGDLVVLADGSVLYAAGASAANPTSTPGCPSARADVIRYLPAG